MLTFANLASKRNLAENFHTSPNTVGNSVYIKLEHGLGGMNVKHDMYVANMLCDSLILMNA